MIRKRYIILLAAALMSVHGACAQNASAEVPRHVVAFYNVEDLFDTEDDPSAADGCRWPTEGGPRSVMKPNCNLWRVLWRRWAKSMVSRL